MNTENLTANVSTEVHFDANEGFDQLVELIKSIKIETPPKVSVDLAIANLHPFRELQYQANESWHGDGIVVKANPHPTIQPNTDPSALNAEVQKMIIPASDDDTILMGYQIWKWGKGNTNKATGKDIYFGYHLDCNNLDNTYFTLFSHSDCPATSLSHDDKLSLLKDSWDRVANKSGWPHGLFQVIKFTNGRQVPTNYFQPSLIVGTKVCAPGASVAMNMIDISENGENPEWLIKILAWGANGDSESVPDVKGFI